MRIRIGTRGSDLARWQARFVAERLTAAGVACEVVVLSTRGDRIDDVPLHQVEGKGFFTAELESALQEERIDLAVHSHKDLPSALPEGLVIAAIPPRASAAERLLIASHAHAPSEPLLPLARGARVGTSAPRRTAQLAALRPDLTLSALRGNVPTRVQRLREGRHDAIVLAQAGLERLGLDLTGLVVVTLPLARLVPAPAQGALALEVRAADAALRALLERVLHDPLAAATVAAERALLVRLGGGCNLPLGVAIEPHGEGWRAQAFLGAGTPSAEAPARWCRAEGASPAEVAGLLGTRLLAGTPTGHGPLEGRTVALTGTPSAAQELAARLATLGARVEREVVLRHEDLEDRELGSRLARLSPDDWVAVTSAHAARRLAGYALPPQVRVAAVGAATARALTAVGWRVDWIGDGGAQELAQALPVERPARVLFPCGAEVHPELPATLDARGVALERSVLYRTVPVERPSFAAAADTRLYLSPSAVNAALAFERAQAPRARRIALGAATSAALANAGLAHVRAERTTPDELLATVIGEPDPGVHTP
jgi:hydroxymethylbilane synthase